MFRMLKHRNVPCIKVNLNARRPRLSTKEHISIGVIKNPLKKIFSMLSDIFHFSAAGTSFQWLRGLVDGTRHWEPAHGRRAMGYARHQELLASSEPPYEKQLVPFSQPTPGHVTAWTRRCWLRDRAKEERAKPTNLDSDLVGQLSNCSQFRRARLRRQIVLQVVVQFDSIKTSSLGKLQTLFQIHSLGIREGPLVNGLFHFVAFQRALPCVGKRRHRRLDGRSWSRPPEKVESPAAVTPICIHARRSSGMVCPKGPSTMIQIVLSRMIFLRLP